MRANSALEFCKNLLVTPGWAMSCPMAATITTKISYDSIYSIRKLFCMKYIKECKTSAA